MTLSLQAKLSALNEGISESKRLKENKEKQLLRGEELLQKNISSKNGIEATLKKFPQNNNTEELEPVKRAKAFIKEHEEKIAGISSKIKKTKEEIRVLERSILTAQKIASVILLQLLPGLREEVSPVITGKAFAISLVYHQITQLSDNQYFLFKPNNEDKHSNVAIEGPSQSPGRDLGHGL